MPRVPTALASSQPKRLLLMPSLQLYFPCSIAAKQQCRAGARSRDIARCQRRNSRQAISPKQKMSFSPSPVQANVPEASKSARELTPLAGSAAQSACHIKARPREVFRRAGSRNTQNRAPTLMVAVGPRCCDCRRRRTIFSGCSAQ